MNDVVSVVLDRVGQKEVSPGAHCVRDDELEALEQVPRIAERDARSTQVENARKVTTVILVGLLKDAMEALEWTEEDLSICCVGPGLQLTGNDRLSEVVCPPQAVPEVIQAVRVLARIDPLTRELALDS